MFVQKKRQAAVVLKKKPRALLGTFILKPKPRVMKGFLATLTPEQRERALAYRGDDTFGDPNDA